MLLDMVTLRLKNYQELVVVRDTISNLQEQ